MSASRRVLSALAVSLTMAGGPLGAAPRVEEGATADDGWEVLFNGEDLTGWTPKIQGLALGEDPHRTFRVEDGVIRVCYDGYDKFEGRFGHLFYQHTYESYDLRIEYRFTGEQVNGGPGWAYRNSGIMVHGQDPRTMREDQDFPVSIEVQLLGGSGEGERATGNLCTPGTNVVIDDALIERHCTNSTSKTYHGDRWVTAEVQVRGNGVIRHLIEGEVVLAYERPQLDPRDADARAWIERQGGEIPLKAGTLSLQSESHPCEFRNLRIRPVPPAESRAERSDGSDGSEKSDRSDRAEKTDGR